MSTGLAEPHEKLASSRYAMVVVALTVFLLAGSLALNRGATSVDESRLALIARRNHANEMVERVDLLTKRDLLPLVQLVIQVWEGPFMGAREVKKSAEDSYFVGSVTSEVPTGLMLTPRRTEKTKLWEASLYRYVDAVTERPEMQGKDESILAARIAGELQELILRGADSAELQHAFEKFVTGVFGPGAEWAKEGDGLLQDSVGLYGGRATKAAMGWIVSGQFIDLEPDSEWREEYGPHGGYPNPPKAGADQPVFSANSLVDKSWEAVRSELISYRTELEKALLQQRVEISSANVAGIGVNLHLADLVGLAGPLLVLAQALYIIALAQEDHWFAQRQSVKSEEHSDSEPAYPQFPRFSAPIDLSERRSSRSFEQTLERVLYGSFLIVPVIVLLLCWLFEYRFAYFKTVAERLPYLFGPIWWQNPLWLNLAGAWHRNADITFLATLNLWAFACSLYVTHRALLVGVQDRYAPRFSRWRAIWIACIVTGSVAFWFVRRGSRELVLAAPVWLCIGLFGFAFTIYRGKLRWLLAAASVVLFVYEMRFLAMFLMPSQDRTWELGSAGAFFVAARDLLPTDGSVLWPVFFVAVATAAAVRRKQIFAIRFFGILSIVILFLIFL